MAGVYICVGSRRYNDAGYGLRSQNPVGSGGFRRLCAAFGDSDHRRPQQAVMKHIAGLQYLDDRAAGLVRPLGLKDRLMEIVIENLALRIDALDSVALEDAQQFALGRCNPRKEASRTLVLRL